MLPCPTRRHSCSGTVPATLKGLTGLTGLYVTGNSLTGTLTGCIDNANDCAAAIALWNNWGSALQWDSYLGNLLNTASMCGASAGMGWSGISCDAATNTRVTNLALFGSLGGTIPAGIGGFDQLLQLDLDKTALTGTIPAAVCNLALLTEIDLYTNQLTGPLPSCIGSLTALSQVYAFQNQLSGALPDGLGSCTALTEVQLYNNKLTALPSTIGGLTKLQILKLGNNALRRGGSPLAASCRRSQWL